MTFQERYLEENIVKTLDRAINQDDYMKLKDELQMHRAQQRLLKPEVEMLQQQYDSVKNSPQGEALKMALEAKKQELQNANDNLDMYKDQGRHALDVDPRDYQIQKAKNEGMTAGGLAGLGAGGLAGAALGSNIFGESVETLVGKGIEEAGFDMNKINVDRTNKSKPFDLKSIPTPSFGEKITNKLNQKVGDIGHKIDQKAKTKFGSSNVDKFKSKISSIDSGLKSIGSNTNDYLKNSDNVKALTNRITAAQKGAPSAAMAHPLAATGLGAGALGLGAMGLNAMFGDGDDVELPEEAPVEQAPVEQAPAAGPEQSVLNQMISKFPGGSTGVNYAAGGLGAAGLAGLIHNHNKRNQR